MFLGWFQIIIPLSLSPPGAESVGAPLSPPPARVLLPVALPAPGAAGAASPEPQRGGGLLGQRFFPPPYSTHQKLLVNQQDTPAGYPQGSSAPVGSELQ